MPLETLRDQSGLCQDGTTAVELLRLARQHGLEAKAYSRDIDGLAALGFPLIVQTDFNHMVVVEAVSPSGVRINDPANGPAELPLAEFSERFTGIVLVLRPPAETSAQPRRGLIHRITRRIRRDWAPLWHALPDRLHRHLTMAAGGAILLTLLPAGLIGTSGGPVFPPLWGLGFCLLCLCARTLLLALTAPAISSALQEAAIITLCQQPGRYFSMRGPERLSAQMAALTAPAEILGGKAGGRGLDLLLLPACLSALPGQGSLTAAGLGSGLILLAALPVLLALRQRTAPWRRINPGPPQLSGLDGLTLTRDTGWAFSGQRITLWASLAGSAARALTDGHRSSLALLHITAPCLLAMSLTALLGTANLLTPFQTGLILLAQGILWRLAAVLPELVALQRTASTLADLLTSAPPAVPPPLLAPDLPPDPVALRVNDLSFGYRPHHPPLLDRLSLTVAPGEQVSLTGPSGVGKSTLFRLIAGLDQPWSGLRQPPTRMALLTEDELFPAGSLRDCLTLSGAIPAPDHVLEQALSRAEAWEFVSPRGGLAMAVPDGAFCFSGGQRRRLALARALLTAPTLIVVDEAFDSLDPDLEARIRQTLRQNGIALLTVTQRPASLRMADRAMMMTAEGLHPWSACPDDTLLPSPEVQPDSGLPVFPRAEHRPLTPEEETILRQAVRMFGGAPQHAPLQASTGSDPLRMALHQVGILTRRVRLRPQDRLEQAAEPLLLRCGGQWRILPAPRPVSPPPDTDALGLCRLQTTAPSTAAPVRLALAIGLVLSLPAALTGGLIRTGAEGGPAPLLLLLAASVGVFPVAIWLRSHSTRSLRQAHASLWSWLLFLPLRVLRHGQADHLEKTLPVHLDRIRHGGPAALTLPPLLTLACITVAGTPAASLLSALAALTLTAAVWKWGSSLRLSPEQSRARRRLSATLRTLTGLRLLAADRAVLGQWQQQEQRLDHARRWPDLLVSLADLAPPAVCLIAASGLWLPAEIPATSLLPILLLLAGLAAHGGGLGAALLRPAPLFPSTQATLPTARIPGPVSDTPVTLSAENLVYTLPGTTSPLIGRAPFTLTLHPGTVTALCGPSGCGKTTLTRLLTGILSPEAGSIRINGVPVEAGPDGEQALMALQACIGWLEQDDTLPVGTVRSHVSGSGAASEAECWQALQAVGMAEAVAALPMGLQAVISGLTLPAGQIRLLHLARVMLTRPAVLILDEALSGLETSRLPGLLGMIRASDCACLLITHRPDILPLADAAWEIRGGMVLPTPGDMSAPALTLPPLTLPGLTLSEQSSAAPYPASGH